MWNEVRGGNASKTTGCRLFRYAIIYNSRHALSLTHVRLPGHTNYIYYFNNCAWTDINLVIIVCKKHPHSAVCVFQRAPLPVKPRRTLVHRLQNVLSYSLLQLIQFSKPVLVVLDTCFPTTNANGIPYINDNCERDNLM